MATALAVDPWTWLLGRTPAGDLWRHVPAQAIDLGQGQDPSQEPRVEVIRRLIAYPSRSFAAVVQAVAACDQDPRRPARWLCYREPGNAPTRPYWVCFVTPTRPYAPAPDPDREQPGDVSGRRFHVGLELYDRERLGLWFFSGYDPSAVPPELRAPFPSRPELSLPRCELQDATLEATPVGTWIREAWEEQLRFSRPSAVPTPARRSGMHTGPADQSGIIDASVMQITREPDGVGGAVAPRAARARLLVQRPPPTESQDGLAPPATPNGGDVALHPLGRLVTVVGRDPRVDVVLEHRTISNEHARIEWRDGVPWVTDLGSKNGSTLDGVPLTANTPRELPLEGRLDLGAVPCLFVRDVEAGPPLAGQQPAAPRHHLRVRTLVGQKRLTAVEAEDVLKEAETRGVTPGEVLVLRRKVGIEEWTHKGGGCMGVVAFIALALALFTSGCHSFAVPPFYEQDLEPAPMRAGERRVEWDWDIALRPLFDARHHAAADRTEAHLLFPLGRMERTPTERRVRLYPVYMRNQRIDPDGFPDDDTLLFPLLVTGTHPVEGGYLYVFPFGGTLKGLLGKDEALGVLFPIYGWTRDRDVETHHVLFPLFATTSGGGASGFRLLPFYGHFEKRSEDGELVFNRTTVLWPFISWADDATNSRNAFHSFVVFPFYGQTRSGWMDDDVVLWPLFRWWHDKRTDYREWRLPFPFFIRGEGPDHSRLDLWPFFGLRHRGGFRRHFALWPIERHEEQDTEAWTDSRTWILPLFWSFTRDWKDGRGSDTRRTIWPLVRWEDRADGAFEVRALAPLWFEDPNEDFDALLDPFWRVFRWRRDAEGWTSLDLLFGLFATRESPHGESRWDILGGLFGRTHAPAKGAPGEPPPAEPSVESRTRLLWGIEF